MSYRAVLTDRASRQLDGFPKDAFDALVETTAVICRDPYNPLATLPTDDQQFRRAEFGASGLVSYYILDDLEQVRITDITWVG